LTVLAATIGIAATGVGLYNNMDRRVLTLEEHDKQQETHFVRIEADAIAAKGDVKGQLDDIKQGQKDTNSKLDQLLFNQVGNRSPATQRWTR
jgi:regulatory protein YycH of two-component signal transduction system YycFG